MSFGEKLDHPPTAGHAWLDVNLSDVGKVCPAPVRVVEGQPVVPPPLDVPTRKVGELNFVFGFCVVLFHFLRHEKSFSDRIADEAVGALSFLSYQAPQY